MTLHEAMITILKKQHNKCMHNKELAKIIGIKGLYFKKDNSNLEGKQICARARKYPDLFEVRNGIIYLK